MVVQVAAFFFSLVAMPCVLDIVRIGYPPGNCQETKNFGCGDSLTSRGVLRIHFSRYHSLILRQRGNVLDATRVADNVKVVFKNVKFQQEVNLTHEFRKDLHEKSPDVNNHWM
jgi:hypothetical protein